MFTSMIRLLYITAEHDLSSKQYIALMLFL